MVGPRFRVLGSLQILGIDRVPSARQQRLLLAALLTTPGESVARSVLADVVWEGAPPADATRSLQVLVARLRTALAPLSVQIDRDEGGYSLHTPADDVDLIRFRECTSVDAGDRGLLEEGLAMWRGEPFGELSSAPYLRSVANELLRRRDQAVAHLHELRLAAGEGADLVPELARWLDSHPLDEAGTRRYAVALAQTGAQRDALRVLHDFRRALWSTAGLEPSPTTAELEHQLLVEPDRLEVRRRLAGRAPLATGRLFGRDEELAEVATLISAHRLVTLVGTGGVGKTRLAVALVGPSAGESWQRAYWCDLAALADARSVALAVCSVLGVEQQAGRSTVENLAVAVGSRRLMLVLDNCEHVLEACRELTGALLSLCGNVHILATSREPLEVSGEVVFRLGPLAVVDERGDSGPAVALFKERGRERGNDVSEDRQTTRAVVEICRGLDGLPLAVELAAARTTALTPQQIVARLDDMFELLRLPRAPTGGLPRHHTLLAAVEWSYQLLEPAERVLFERLSVFSGTFGLEAVEGICADPPLEVGGILRLVEILVDRSLVVAENSPSGKRYRLLDTLRHFARDRVSESADAGELAGRHARWYAAFAADADRRARLEGSIVWHERMHWEIDNLTLAFERLIWASDIDRAQQLVSGTWTPLGFPGLFAIAQTDWAPAALAIDPAHVGPATASVRAMAAFGAVMKGQHDEAWALANSALAAVAAGADDDGCAANVMAVLVTFTRRGRQQAAGVAEDEVRRARRLGDRERLIRALLYRHFTRSREELTERMRDAEEAVELARRDNQQALLALALWHLAWLKHHVGDPTAEDAARAAARQGARAHVGLVEAYAAQQLGTIAVEQRRPIDVLRYVTPALEFWRASGDARSWTALYQIAEALAEVGHDEIALRIWGAIGDRNLGSHIRLHRQRFAAACIRVAAAQRQRLLEAGSRLSLDDVIELALAAISAVTAEVPRHSGGGGDRRSALSKP